MGIRLPVIIHAKQILRRSLQNASQAASTSIDVPKGYLAVYVGETQKKRFLVPVSYLNLPLFQDLLRKAEEEFGYNHPMSGLTIPCREDSPSISLPIWIDDEYREHLQSKEND